MGSRGRKPDNVHKLKIAHATRPDAPHELPERESLVWSRVVGALPVDWFKPEHYDLLTQYCRHAVASEVVAGMAQTVISSGEVDVDIYDKLLRMHEREGRALSSLATRMRLTPQASYHPEKSKQVSATAKPWE